MTFLHTSVLLPKEQDHQRYHLKLKTVHWPIYGNYLHIAILHAHVLRIDFEELKKITPQCIYQMDGIKQGNITTRWPNWQILIEPVEPLKALHISWGTYFNLWNVFVIYLCLTQNCTQWMYTNHNGKRNLTNAVISNHFTLFFCKRLHSDRAFIVIIFSIDWLEINSGISLAQG